MGSNKTEDKLESIDSRLASIDTTLALQHKSLKEHMRRTEILESQIKPLQTFQDRLKGALTLVLSSGAILAFLKLLRLL